MKRALKQLARTFATLVMLPVVACYYVHAALVGKNRAFPGFSQFASLWPGSSGNYLRAALYRLILPRCGDGVCISFGTLFSHPTAVVGDDVYIGIGCMVGDATIESDVLIGSNVSVINGGRQHDTRRLDVPVRLQPGTFPRVTIGQDSWIGDRAVVMADVGRHCVVGAGAVVTKPVPDFAIVAGSPARVVNWRQHTDKCEANGSDDCVNNKARKHLAQDASAPLGIEATREGDEVIGSTRYQSQ